MVCRVQGLAHMPQIGHAPFAVDLTEQPRREPFVTAERLEQRRHAAFLVHPQPVPQREAEPVDVAVLEIGGVPSDER